MTRTDDKAPGNTPQTPPPTAGKDSDFQSEFAALVELVGQGVKDVEEDKKDDFLQDVTIKAPPNLKRRPQSKWSKIRNDLGLEMNFTAIAGIFFLLLSIGFAALIEWRESTMAKRANARMQAFNQTTPEAIDIFNTIANTGGSYKPGANGAAESGEQPPAADETAEDAAALNDGEFAHLMFEGSEWGPVQWAPSDAIANWQPFSAAPPLAYTPIDGNQGANMNPQRAECSLDG